jgi:hypothetical protein
MIKGALSWFHPNHNASRCALNIVEKSLMIKGAFSWFHNVSTYGGEVIEY